MFGLAGEMLSGKSSAAKFLVQHFPVKELRMSMILNKILDLLVLPASRQNQQTLARILREQFGDYILAHAVGEYAKEQKDHVFLIDGIRKLDELKELQQRANFKLIYVKAPMQLRYQRLKQRQEKVGEELKTFEEFENAHGAESEIDIQKLLEYADFVIENSGDDQKFQADLTRVFTLSI